MRRTWSASRLLRKQVQHRYLGRHAKPGGNDAGADAGSDEEMASLFYDVSFDVAVRGRVDGRAKKWKAHLPAMRVSRDQQAHSFGDIRKDIGIVSHKNHGFRRIGLRERAFDVRTVGPEIGNAAQPEGFPVMLQPHCGISQNRNTC